MPVESALGGGGQRTGAIARSARSIHRDRQARHSSTNRQDQALDQRLRDHRRACAPSAYRTQISR
jgi:hypothetical protein